MDPMGNGKQWKPLDTLFCLADAFLRVTATLVLSSREKHIGEKFSEQGSKNTEQM